MSKHGHGAIAIWHDIAPEGRENFYAWHGQEHMPERVGIPGFVVGRRFVAIEADREFFNLYETAGPTVVTSAAYHERLANPSPWTLESVVHFRHVARSLCAVVASAGNAEGGIVATLRVQFDETAAARPLAELVRPLATEPGIAAVHLLAADLEASGFVNAEQRARGTTNETPSHTLLVEGWADEAPFRSRVGDRLAPLMDSLARVGATPVLGFYRHQATVRAERPKASIAAQ